MNAQIQTSQQTSQALEIMGTRINSFQEAVSIAEYFSGTDLVPKDYRGKPANMMVAWQKGLELGLKPLQALATIAVVNGRATIWGDGLIALVKNSSKEEWTHEVLEGDGDNMVAICETKRTSQEQTIKRSFSVKDAKKACLWGNNTWAKYPKRMLQMRARGLCLRDAYPDVLNGLEIAEEINDLHYQQKTEAQQAPKTLSQVGLVTVEKDGMLVVQGNSYGKSELLKQLGFQYSNNVWCKELPKGEEIIDVVEASNANAPANDSSHISIKKRFSELLKELGLPIERQKEFVMNYLGLVANDTSGMQKAIDNTEELKNSIDGFLAEPIVEHVS